MVRINIGDKVKAFDIFGEQVKFKIDGKESHRTYIGAFMSFLVIAITFTYGLERFNVLIDRGDTLFISTEEPFYFSKEAPLS